VFTFPALCAFQKITTDIRKAAFHKPQRI
jgi:hypothetical protein